MAKLSLTVAASIAVVAAIFAPSLAARQNAAARFEYMRLSPYIVQVKNGPNSVREMGAYRACLAASTEWTCRKFESTELGEVALRTALVTLGNEGWELVSAVDEMRSDTSRNGLTYLFKRPR